MGRVSVPAPFLRIILRVSPVKEREREEKMERRESHYCVACGEGVSTSKCCVCSMDYLEPEKC